MIKATVTITGEEKALAVVDPARWAKLFKIVSPKVLETFGNEYVNRVRHAINTGAAGGPELSERWAAFKGHSVKWLHEGDLRDSLATRMLGQFKVFAGIHADARNSAGKNLALIGASLEIGTVVHPPRPLFEPIAQDLMRDSKYAANLIEESIKEHEKEVFG